MRMSVPLLAAFDTSSSTVHSQDFPCKELLQDSTISSTDSARTQVCPVQKQVRGTGTWRWGYSREP